MPARGGGGGGSRGWRSWTRSTGRADQYRRRRNALHASLLFQWRRELRERTRSAPAPPAQSFVPVRLPPPTAPAPPAPACARPCARQKELDLLRLRCRRRTRCSHLHPDRDGKTLQRRSARPASRRARPHRRSPGQPHRQPAALQLADRTSAGRAAGRLIRRTLRPSPDAYLAGDSVHTPVVELGDGHLRHWCRLCRCWETRPEALPGRAKIQEPQLTPTRTGLSAGAA